MSTDVDTRFEISHRGGVSAASLSRAIEKVTAVADRCREPIHHVELRLVADGRAGRSKPALAESTLATKRKPVRAHVAAASVDEAVDLLVDRLRRRLERYEDRLHREHQRSRSAVDAHFSDGNGRPEFIDLPRDYREIVRSKSFSDGSMTVEEALFDLQQLDHSFYVFSSIDCGCDCMIERSTDGFVLRSVDPDQYGGGEMPRGVRRSDSVAPTLGLDEAREFLDATGADRIFHRDPGDSRGQVLYRRFDGHYGLVTLH
ncbi:MAG: hypothetical protein GY708_15880 [Actinomycetia bacterium]|nr:hypothetical protein [Actinomycetes bacterium]MCP4960743.1 hypothetical protein [Actinomycetes bacterium]